MITIYGSDQCPKTVKILALCKERGIEVEYKSFAVLKNIWTFCVIRDSSATFDKTRQAKRLGIPGIVCENGYVFDGGEEPFDAEKVMVTIVANSKK